MISFKSHLLTSSLSCCIPEVKGFIFCVYFFFFSCSPIFNYRKKLKIEIAKWLNILNKWFSLYETICEREKNGKAKSNSFWKWHLSLMLCFCSVWILSRCVTVKVLQTPKAGENVAIMKINNICLEVWNVTSWNATYYIFDSLDPFQRAKTVCLHPIMNICNVAYERIKRSVYAMSRWKKSLLAKWLSSWCSLSDH